MTDGSVMEAESPLRWRDLVARGNRGGEVLPAMVPPLDPDDIVLRGRFRMEMLRSGLSLHATDAVDLRDMTTAAAAGAGLTVALFLRGEVDISLGERRYVLSAAREPVLFLLSRTEEDRFQRHAMRGNWVRKITLGLPPDWLDGAGGDGGALAGRTAGEGSLRRFCRTHGASMMLRPTARQVALAERLTGPIACPPMLESLYLESHALEIVAEALGMVDMPAAHPLSSRDSARLRIACEFLESRDPDDDAPLRLEEVARHAGMSVSTLHRLFRAGHGMSVFEYERSRRMERARTALECEGVSVTEAAYLAGYSSPANFATAFKRRFGRCPREARATRIALPPAAVRG
ncbi:AraC family transcriptional regulator (plasmid) [Azospirillum humicireducens]|uniref:AraC family transcriptional regulator n=1 Tax=Azospirillum humicireducens TaxID=1226968 RepID=A0A2R4VS67_9PROT|nr:AraC family transcriptional regulator [Azospirillum humicireducens]AWB07264.1 AraC family transcriptional regulator [Azospirillum humicireducens]